MITLFRRRLVHDLVRGYCIKNIMPNTSIPERWLEYSRIGEKINNFPFVCFKTPLSEEFNYNHRTNRGLSVEEEFTPTQLLQALRNKRYRLGMVVDLTNTYRYYNGRREFEDRHGILYTKIKFDAYSPGGFNPAYRTFASEVRNFLDVAERDVAIGVHCTHGVNRTGYMICRYMIEEHGYRADDAVSLFNESKKENLEKYIDLLREIEKKKRREAQAGWRERGASRDQRRVFHFSRR